MKDPTLLNIVAQLADCHGIEEATVNKTDTGVKIMSDYGVYDYTLSSDVLDILSGFNGALYRDNITEYDYEYIVDTVSES